MELIADLELRQQPPSSVAWYVFTFQGPRAVQAVCWVPQYLHVMKKLARTNDPIGSTGAEEKLQLQFWVNSEHNEEHAAAEGRATFRAHGSHTDVQGDMHHLKPQSESFRIAIVCCWGFPAHGKHHSGSFADERPKLWDVPVHTTYSQFRQSVAELSGYVCCHDCPWHEQPCLHKHYCRQHWLYSLEQWQPSSCLTHATLRGRKCSCGPCSQPSP